MDSIKYTLNTTDLKKIGTGAMVATIGALLTYLTQVITQIDFGQWTPIVVAVYGVLANIVRKFLAGYSA